jgi:hypothetical protein
MRALLPVAAALAVGCAQDYEVVPKSVDVNPGDITECGFTRIDDTDFYRYDCNPVFTTTGEDWAGQIRSTAFYVTEVLDHPFYQMWYTGMPDGAGDGDFSLGYAVSAEGTDWVPSPENPLLDAPASSEWDADAMDGMQVVWDTETDQYVLLYQGYNLGGDTTWGLGVATSPDGRDWRRIDSNPVVDLADPDSAVHYCWPLGLSLGDIAGFTGYVAGGRGMSQKCEVYRINAANVSTWNPDEDVVFEAGESGEWDDEGFISLAIADLKGKRRMFYVGFSEWLDHPTEENVIVANHAFLGMATMEDNGWTREGGIIPVNMTEDGEISSVAARKVGSRIHLWITDNYDDVSAVGYFLYDPDAAAAEDAGGATGEEG